MEISEVQAVRPVRLTQLQGPSSQVPSAQRLSSAAASPTATEPPAATRLEQHRARGCVPTAHEEPHTRDSSQITPVRADKGQASGTCHSGLALRAALAARLPVRRAAPRALASPPKASIAAGGSFEACAVRETGPDPAGCSRAGPGKAGPPGPRPAARPALTGSHEGIGPARPGAERGLPGDGLQGKRQGTAEEAEDERAAPMPNERLRGTGRGASGGGGAREARGHARDSLTRPPRHTGVLPAAAFCRPPLRDQSRPSAEAAAAANGTAGRREERCYWTAAGEARPERRRWRAARLRLCFLPSCGRGVAPTSVSAGREVCGGGGSPCPLRRPYGTQSVCAG